MSVAEIEARELELEPAGSGLWRDALHRLVRNPGAIVGFVLVAAFVLVAIFAPWLAPYHPLDQDLDALAAGCCPGPSSEHWLGQDDLGRDELSRLIYGARYSLLICVVAVSVGLSAGLLLGACAGYFRRSDGAIMRVMDVMLAIPGFLMAIGIVALFGGGGLVPVMIAIGVVNIPIFTRLMRGSILAQRDNDYVLSFGIEPERQYLPVDRPEKLLRNVDSVRFKQALCNRADHGTAHPIRLLLSCQQDTAPSDLRIGKVVAGRGNQITRDKVSNLKTAVAGPYRLFQYVRHLRVRP